MKATATKPHIEQKNESGRRLTGCIYHQYYFRRQSGDKMSALQKLNYHPNQDPSKFHNLNDQKFKWESG